MTLKSYLWGMRIITLVSLVAWGFVVYSVNPYEAGISGKTLFYLSLFLFLSGVFILSLTWARRKFSGGEQAFIHLGMSFRQGILLAILTIILLVFQSFKILLWWDGALVVASIFMVELYFLTR